MASVPHNVIVRVNPETMNWQAVCADCPWRAGQRADRTADELADDHRADASGARDEAFGTSPQAEWYRDARDIDPGATVRD